MSHYSLGAFTALPLDVFVNFICQIIDVRHKGGLHFHSIGMLGYHWFKKKKSDFKGGFVTSALILYQGESSELSV